MLLIGFIMEKNMIYFQIMCKKGRKLSKLDDWQCFNGWKGVEHGEYGVWNWFKRNFWDAQKTLAYDCEYDNSGSDCSGSR